MPLHGNGDDDDDLLLLLLLDFLQNSTNTQQWCVGMISRCGW